MRPRIASHGAVPYPRIGQPLPRAAEACVASDKWRGWILAANGHGPQWARVFGLGESDGERLWGAITERLGDASVSVVRHRPPHGVVCGAVMSIQVNGGSASVTTAWHYA